MVVISEMMDAVDLGLDYSGCDGRLYHYWEDDYCDARTIVVAIVSSLSWYVWGVSLQ